jgi:hypothetical protein
MACGGCRVLITLYISARHEGHVSGTMHALVCPYLRIYSSPGLSARSPWGSHFLNRGDRIVPRFCAIILLVTDLVPETDSSGTIQAFMQVGDRGTLFFWAADVGFLG